MLATPGFTKTELRVESRQLLVRAYVSLTIFGALWGGVSASRFVVNHVSGGGTFGLLLFVAIITAVPMRSPCRCEGIIARMVDLGHPDHALLHRSGRRRLVATFRYPDVVCTRLRTDIP
jgi:hypothetical protein